MPRHLSHLPPALPPSLLTMHETTSPPPPMTMPVLSTSSQTFNASSSSQPRAYPTARFPVSSASAHNTATFYRQLPQLPPIPSPSCYSSLPTARLALSSAPPADPLWTSDDVAADFFQLNIKDEPRMMPLESMTPYEGDSNGLRGILVSSSEADTGGPFSVCISARIYPCRDLKRVWLDWYISRQ